MSSSLQDEKRRSFRSRLSQKQDASSPGTPSAAKQSPEKHRFSLFRTARTQKENGTSSSSSPHLRLEPGSITTNKTDAKKGEKNDGESLAHAPSANQPIVEELRLSRGDNYHLPAVPGAERVGGIDADEGTITFPAVDEEQPEFSAEITTPAPYHVQERDIVAMPVQESTQEISVMSGSSTNAESRERVITSTDVVSVDPAKEKRNKRILITTIILLVIIVAAVSMGLVYGLGRSSNQNDSGMPPPSVSSTPVEPTAQPTTFESDVSPLILAVSPDANIDDSPQNLALEWMISSAGIFRGLSDERLLQIYALTTLWYSTNGNTTWTHNDGWLDAEMNECSWGGGDVTCDPFNNKVIQIRLNGDGLTGKIPPEVGLLTALTQLRLRDNEISSSLPSELGLLRKLEEFSARQNNITGSLPSELGELTKMTELILYTNFMSGSIPTEVGYLTQLTVLSVRDNLLTGTLPSELGNMVNSNRLWLQNNKFTGTIPTEMGRLTIMERMRLYGNNITGPMPAALCGGTLSPQIDCDKVSCPCCSNSTGHPCPV